MAPLNPQLLDRLVKKLGVTKARVYSLIQTRSHDLGVQRHVAALALARDNGIGIQRYATPDDFAELRGVVHSKPLVVSAPVAEKLTKAAVSRKHKPKLKSSVAKKPSKQNTVFVVHGRDHELTKDMYALLSALRLDVQEWGHAISAATVGTGNPYTSNVVTKVMKRAAAIVVMLTPDDEVKLRPQFIARHEKATEGKLLGQPRANVLFETGIAIGTHPKKTLIVKVGMPKPFSDIDGMHIINLTGGSISARRDFAARLKKLGCKVDTDGEQWLSVGAFRPALPKVRPAKK